MEEWITQQAAENGPWAVICFVLIFFIHKMISRMSKALESNNQAYIGMIKDSRVALDKQSEQMLIVMRDMSNSTQELSRQLNRLGAKIGEMSNSQVNQAEQEKQHRQTVDKAIQSFYTVSSEHLKKIDKAIEAVKSE